MSSVRLVLAEQRKIKANVKRNVNRGNERSTQKTTLNSKTPIFSLYALARDDSNN